MKVKEVKCQKWESGKVGKFLISLTGVFRDKGYMVTAVTVTSSFRKKQKISVLICSIPKLFVLLRLIAGKWPQRRSLVRFSWKYNKRLLLFGIV